MNDTQALRARIIEDVAIAASSAGYPLFASLLRQAVHLPKAFEASTRIPAQAGADKCPDCPGERGHDNPCEPESGTQECERCNGTRVIHGLGMTQSACPDCAPSPALVQEGMKQQTDREIAEMIAKFRTPPGMNWQPLADDIETVLKSRRTPALQPVGGVGMKSCQPFEAHPILASHIRRMANTGHTGDASDWSGFLDALNAAVRRTPTPHQGGEVKAWRDLRAAPGDYPHCEQYSRALEAAGDAMADLLQQMQQRVVELERLYETSVEGRRNNLERWEAAEAARDLAIKALEKLKSYNVDIRDGRINYRPEDHIAVCDAALTPSNGGQKDG